MKYWQALLIAFLGSCVVALVLAMGLVKVNIKLNKDPVETTQIQPASAPLIFDVADSGSETVSTAESARILGESTTEETTQKTQVTTSTYTAPTRLCMNGNRPRCQSKKM